jgi:hypothetical protein
MIKKVKKMAYGGIVGQTDVTGTASGAPQSAFGQPTTSSSSGVGLGNQAPLVNIQNSDPSQKQASSGPLDIPPAAEVTAQKRGGIVKAKAKVKKMAKGGFIRAADGAAKRGKTRGRTV